MNRFAWVAAGVAILSLACVLRASADDFSMPAAHPDFQSMHVAFGTFRCTFHLFNGKTIPVAGVTELSSDGRRAVSHDPYGVYFSNLWYDSSRKLWILTSIYTFNGLDISATSRGWSDGTLVFSGFVSLRNESLPYRGTTTELAGDKSREVDEIQDEDGAWHTLDTSVCGKA